MQRIAIAAFAAGLTFNAAAHEINSGASDSAAPAFDIITARVAIDGDDLVFHQQLAGAAGTIRPAATGQLAGSSVYSYVWPTSLDSAKVGFDPDQGILALAVTVHPDFDDTPLADENGDGDTGNDGNLWHSHWVVLVSDDACGSGALKVRDIPTGTKPALPPTWPGLPMLIDSPGFTPALTGADVEVRVPLRAVGAQRAFKFDGVTAGLRVNQSVHDPLLCVVNVFDVASGDLSLPGEVQ